MSEDILATLDNLTEEELSRFKWFLQQPEILPGLPSLTTKHLENAKRLQVLDVMLKTYTLQQSLEITCQILKKINRNDLQQRLLQSKKEELKKKDSEFQEMIKYRQGKIEEIRVSIKISKDDEDKQKAEGVEVFTALKESVVRGLMELINEIEDKQKTAEKQAEDLIKDLEQEICALLKRSSEVKQLSQSKDHLHFLQRFSSVKATPPTKSWTKIRVHPPSYDGPVERAVGLLEEKIKEKRKEAELRRVRQYAVDVTLDPNTAHPKLIISDDGKQVKHGDIWNNLPENQERFSNCIDVLGRQSFSSGRFYFEVQVKGKTEWDIGVARESINRKGDITLSPQDGYWALWLRNRNRYHAGAEPGVRLHLQSSPEKVGVFVDYEEGLISFYDVDTAALIYSFTGCCFNQKLYPIFSPCLNDGGKNSAPLVICPVNHVNG